MNDIPSPQTNVSEEFVTEKLPVGWPWRLLIFSILIFILTLFVYFGIRFGYSAYLSQQSADLDSSLEVLANEVNTEDQERFVSFYSQIVNLKSVLDRHLWSSNLFTFLEQNAIDGVVFTEARFEDTARILQLQGTVTSFDLLAQQMGVFEKSSAVENVLLDDVSVVGGTPTFKLSVYLSEMFFKKPATL